LEREVREARYRDAVPEARCRFLNAIDLGFGRLSGVDADADETQFARRFGTALVRVFESGVELSEPSSRRLLLYHRWIDVIFSLGEMEPSARASLRARLALRPLVFIEGDRPRRSVERRSAFGRDSVPALHKLALHLPAAGVRVARAIARMASAAIIGRAAERADAVATGRHLYALQLRDHAEEARDQGRVDDGDAAARFWTWDAARRSPA
jgi:hypothetical protein